MADIVIRRPGGPAQRIDTMNIYVSFASGRFRYDCARCRAACCRGCGYYLQVGRELRAHLAARPSVRFFLDRPDRIARGYYRVRNSMPSCFFLDERERCEIHARFGYDAKPETCRLFPFNNLRRVGDYLVVAPHSTLCPLDVVALGSSATESSHELVVAGMRAADLSDVKSGQAVLPAVENLIGLEREIVRLSESHLGDADYEPFAAVQAVATERTLRAVDESQWHQARSGVGITRFTEMFREVLDADRAACDHDPGTVQTLVASTGALRTSLVFGPDRRHLVSAGVTLERIPHVLAGLHVVSSLARQAGMPRITYQAVNRLFDDFLPLLSMLACIDRCMVWRPDAPIKLEFDGDGDSRGRYLRIVRALVPPKRNRSGSLFGQILCENLSTDPVERVLFLKALARRLAGNVIPLGRRSEPRSPVARIRCGLQRCVLRAVSDDVLVAVAERLHARRDVTDGGYL
jgi:hypothetical protein